MFGPLTLERAYYHCTNCGAGFFPHDRALGLQGTHLTPGVTRMVAAVGASVSFAEGSSLLRELAAMDVDAKHVERAGMHWSLRGANAILALRCCRLSGRSEDFWERRALRSAA